MHRSLFDAFPFNPAIVEKNYDGVGSYVFLSSTVIVIFSDESRLIVTSDFSHQLLWSETEKPYAHHCVHEQDQNHPGVVVWLDTLHIAKHYFVYLSKVKFIGSVLQRDYFASSSAFKGFDLSRFFCL